ncbi:MAG TPA: FtsX-like permease family protein, partial [Candidatus Dormibacteraeota bacterium]|nr:FtsX-like permease family protein [Candidatus Dormibacteraeota bacterium]
MRAVIFKALKDLRRRRLQAAVVFVTALLSVGAGTMALTLISQTRDPYMTAFDAQRGAHLQVWFDRHVDPATIAGTPALIGASDSSGPFPASDVQIQRGGHKTWITVIGRDAPDARVGALRILKGRWPANDQEIAVTHSFADLNHVSVGGTFKAVSAANAPVLTISGEVADIDQVSASIASQNAWMLPSAIPAIDVPGRTSDLMAYRFASDPSSAQLQGDVTRLRDSLPPGSVAGSVNYLGIRTAFNVTNQITTGILLAFSVFALLATVAVVANLVTGIVISAYREIGIMKALGFTPLQVELVFVLQIVIPVAAAALIALPIGTLASQPVLASGAEALGLAYQPVFSAVPDLVALIGALVLVSVAAFLPALRAGRLRPTAIIASASAPRGKSGRWLRRLAERLRLPRTVGMGAGDAFARPVRAIFTVFAVFVAVVTVVVAAGLPRSILRIYASEGPAQADVVVERSPALSDADTLRIINANSRTAHVVGELDGHAAVPGIGDPVPTRMFRGDASHLGLQVIAGRWFSAPGEVVAPRALIHDANLKLGDHFTITAGTQPVSVVLVGEIYDVANLGYSMFFDLATVSQVEPDAAPTLYLVMLTPGADADAYVRAVAAAQPDLLDVQKNTISSGATLSLVDVIVAALAAVITVIGIAAIFNTLLLNSRERIRDTATLKALGMSPRQLVVMVAASAGVLALVGGVLAAPAGYGLNALLMTAIDGGIGGNGTPAALIQVYAPWELVAIPL